MEKLSKILDEIYNREFTESKNKIKQSESVALKRELTHALMQELASFMDARLTIDGLTLEIPNKELGSVFAVVDIRIKPLDYDIETAVELYNEKVNDRNAKDEEKKRKEKERIEKTQKNKKG